MNAKRRDKYDFMFNVDFRKYYEILIEQKEFILVFCLSAILSSLALTYVFSERYVAFTNIYYRPLERSLLRQKDVEAFGGPAPVAPFNVIIQSLQDIIRSDAILGLVVEELGLDKPAKPEYAHWYLRWYHNSKDFIKSLLLDTWSLLKYGRVIEEHPKVKAIIEVRKGISVQATKDSYIYILSVKDKYSERAAKIVDTAGQYLVNWLKEQDHSPAQSKCLQLQERLEEKEAEIRRLRDDRDTLLKENDFIAAAEETAEGVKNLYAVEQEAVHLEAQIEEKRERLAEVERQIQKKTEGYINPADVKRMESERLFLQLELRGLVAKGDFQRSSIAQLKERLRNLRNLQKAIDNLDMQIDASERDHLHLRDLYVEAISAAGSAQSEIKILNPAQIPTKPVQPIKIYHVGLTTILSLLFSIGLIYVLAFFNIRTFFSSKGVTGRREVEQKAKGKSFPD
jgi:uncharacterized protein involved in exopolysaccharide biosynthesis